MTKITEAAGIGKSTFYNFFASKEIFVNFLRIMALAVAQKEALHQESLNETFDLIFDAMFGYIFTTDESTI